MNGDTVTYEYRAVRDKLAKRWHLGSVQTHERTFCGVTLYPDAERGYRAELDLALIDCGACKRMGRYKTDVAKYGVDAEPAQAKPARKTATRKPAVKKAPAAAAGSEHEGDGGRQAPTAPAPKKRPTRATRSAELSAAAKAKREADSTGQ